VALAPDQSGSFEHFQVTRNRRERNVERLGQLANGRIAESQSRQDSAPGWIGESGKCDIESYHLTAMLNGTRFVKC
jgi:hypothetical protein